MTRGGVYNKILPELEGNPEGGAQRDFPMAKAVFHCIPRLESQYSHSQLPLLANILIKELAFFVISI